MLTAEQAYRRAVERKRSIEDRGYITPCWIFTKGTTVAGYGQVWGDGKVLSLHRLSLKCNGVDIPAHMDTEHLCHQRACFNPDHLRPQARKDNPDRSASGKASRQARK